MANVIEIQDLSVPELAPYTQLTHAQLRSQRESEKGIFIAESTKVISCALRAGCRPLSFLTEDRHLPALISLIPERWSSVPIYTAPRETLASLTGYALTRGVLCAMARPALPTPEEVCRTARRLVVLENITDSTNIGAIFRSAAALGMDGVLLSPSCCDPFYRRAVRGEHGHRLSDPLGLAVRRRLPVASARPVYPPYTGVFLRSHGPDRPLHLH